MNKEIVIILEYLKANFDPGHCQVPYASYLKCELHLVNCIRQHKKGGVIYVR